MKFYDFALSPNCQKVAALAREVGVPLEIVAIDLFKGEAKTPAMLAKNPNGKLPINPSGVQNNRLNRSARPCVQ